MGENEITTLAKQYYDLAQKTYQEQERKIDGFIKEVNTSLSKVKEELKDEIHHVDNKVTTLSSNIKVMNVELCNRMAIWKVVGIALGIIMVLAIGIASYLMTGK